MGEIWSTLFWRHLWQITLLIPVIVLALRWTCKQRSHFAYALLLIVLLKCVVPPAWPSSVGVFCWLEGSVAAAENLESMPPASEDVVRIHTTLVQQTEQPSSGASFTETASVSNLPWALAGLIIWAAGSVTLLGYLIGKQRQLRRFHLETQVESSDELLELVEEVSYGLHLIHTPRVLVTLHPTIPFAIGVFDPLVVLPHHLVQQTSRDELELILAHEMTHLRRGDLMISSLQLLVRILWWFHPFVWWLNREIRRVREQCCDEDVVTRLNCLPSRYAHCLLSVLEMQKQLCPSPGLAGLSPFEVTAIRLENIMTVPKRTKSSQRKILAICCMILLSVIILPGGTLPASSPQIFEEEQIVADIPEPTIQPELEPVTPQLAKQPVTPSEKQNPKPISTEPVTNLPNSVSEVIGTNGLSERRLAYWIRIEADHPEGRKTFQANPVFDIRAESPSSDQDVTDPRFPPSYSPFSMRSRVGRPYYEFPDPYPYSPSFSGGSRPVREQIGRNLSVLSDEPQVRLPYYLGTAAQFVFPLMADRSFKTWHRQGNQSLWINSNDGLHVAFTPTQADDQLPAEFDVSLQFKEQTETSLTMLRDWSLTTHAKLKDEPVKELIISGELVYSLPDMIPQHGFYTGKVIERSDTGTIEIPVSIKLEQLTP